MAQERTYPIQMTTNQMMQLILLIEDDADRKTGIGSLNNPDLEGLRAQLIYTMTKSNTSQNI